MSLLFVDGFDYYPTADLPQKWTSVINDGWDGSTPTIVQQGRFGAGTGAVQMGGSGNAGLVKSLNNTTNLVIGFAFKISKANAGNRNVLSLLSGAASNPFVQGQLTLNSGVITYTNGLRNNISVNSSVGIVPNVWYYLEYKTTIGTSIAAGTTQMRLNGVVVIDVAAGSNVQGDYLNGVNTIKQATLFGSGNQNDGQIILVDDLYVGNTDGTVNNDFLGDIRIETLYPSAAGDATQFTPTSSANWKCVSETPEDGDNSYVMANTPGMKDLYQLADLSSNPTLVHGLQVATIGRKDDAGARLVSPIVKSGGTEFTHSVTNPFGLADNYTTHLDMWENDPNANGPWTGGTINAMQLGVKVVS